MTTGPKHLRMVLPTPTQSGTATSVTEKQNSKPSLPSTELDQQLQNNPAAQAGLATMLASLFRGLRTYGKTPEDLDGTIDLFKLVLAEFNPDDIQAAMVKWLKTSNQFPAPSDVADPIKE